MAKKAQTQSKQQEQLIVNRYSEMTDEQLKAAIDGAYQEIDVLETKQDQRLIAAGEKLVALKARVKHGQWQLTLKGLRGGKGIPPQTARQWMRYAKDPLKLEQDREAWRNRRDQDGPGSSEDAFKEKIKQDQQGADYGFYTDDSRHSNFGGRPAEEVLPQEIRKVENALARIEKVVEFAEYIEYSQEALDQIAAHVERYQRCLKVLEAPKLSKPIHPDILQLGVLH